MDNILRSAFIADLHFSAMDPRTQYKILQEQFLAPISQYKLDLIGILGDIFDHKLLANSDGVMVAMSFVNDVLNIARNTNATVIIIAGTLSHDSNQLKLFYHFLEDPTVDLRIVTDLSFQDVKGKRVLCIPELYGLPEEVYQTYLFGSGDYDIALMHGTFKGGVYRDNVKQSRLFTIEDFVNCKGFIVAGHVHEATCLNVYFYYCGCPYRWKFGEERDKGYILALYDAFTRTHFINFEKIESFRYITLNYEDIVSDAQLAIQWIKDIKARENIDFIKVRFRTNVSEANKAIITNYYRNSNDTFVEFPELSEEKTKEMSQVDTYNEYSFLFDDKLTPEQKLVLYINKNEGEGFITVEALQELLSE